MSQIVQQTSNLAQHHLSGKEAHSHSKLISALVSFGVFLLLALVVKLSLWQGSYNLDPHHWGLMLSNAKDLVDGKIPYKEIFIQYGILTTLIHAFAYKYLGGNLQSIILISSIAYAIGIWGIYSLCRTLYHPYKSLVLLTFISVFIFHPITIYPWSNYVAFPFIVWGLVYSLAINKTWHNNIIVGLLFSLAVLCREGLFVAIILYLLSSTLIDLNACRLDKTPIKNLGISNLLMYLGFSLPLITFFLYLNYSNNLGYWHLLSINLPKIYIKEIFPYMQGFGVITHFIDNVFKELLSFNSRWYLVIFITLVCLKIFFFGFLNINKKSFLPEVNDLKIAILSLLLISSTSHLPEIFRLATGTILGVIVFHKKLSNLKYGKLIISILMLWMIIDGFGGFAGNYYLPKRENVANSIPVESPKIFIGQKWHPDVSNYYNQITKDLTYLYLNNDCRLKYQFNSTPDAFLYILSPFKSNQIMPFNDGPHGTSNQINSLRPDLNFKEKIKRPSDMIVIAQFRENALEKYKTTKGFDLYKLYKMPDDLKTKYSKHDDYLGVFIPKICKAKNHL